MLIIERRLMDILPSAARQIVRRLEADYHEMIQRQSSSSERLNHLMTMQGPLLARADGGAGLSPDERDHLRSVTDDLEVARSRHQEAVTAGRDAAQIFSAAIAWLSQARLDPDRLRASRQMLVDVPLPRPAGNLESTRQEIANATRERMEVERAPLSRASLEENIREQVKTLSARFSPQMTGIDGRGVFDIIARDVKPLALLAWFDPEKLVQRFLADLPEFVDGGLSPEDKKAKLAEIDARRLELERMEEALVRASPGTPRRIGVDIAAVLSVELRPVEEVKAA